MEAGDAAEWLLHAESDLQYAMLGRGAPGILQSQVAFHTQQAAEKALKAVLVHASVDFPRTHDLQALLMLIGDGGIAVPPELEGVNALTRFAVETRYPSGADHAGRAGASDRPGGQNHCLGAGPDSAIVEDPMMTPLLPKRRHCKEFFRPDPSD
jgi:HEPN domain-containing protein